ncbi:glutamate 5-kinase [Okeania sp.]|uniref:glutamate 5-kinase n=1 Tax=Okeania sp. TaxID=3100323 RepID=UPI002B4AD9C2|nr:glutamate 5-kinase [Okeania sp.]MEB3343300.1 glutamate 5-kinase [Okeania sp.]
MNTIVIKIGTSSLTNSETGNLALSTISSLIETITNLTRQGNRVVLVSSGAVGVGRDMLGLTEKPKNISMKQAVAAVGQGRLMRVYDDLFSSLQQTIAQILLTRSDLSRRSSYVNAYNTFQQLFQLGVVPIVNENDTTAVEELKFGDNDNLSALVASLVEADWLFILTDVDRLYSADPRSNPDAVPIALIKRMEQLEELQVQTGKSVSGRGTGGMITKIEAAKIATAAGVRTVITNGKIPSNILKILNGESIGTQFEPQPRQINARKHWIANVLVPIGQLYLDQGAVRAISELGKSLLAAGIIQVEGEFNSSDAVQLCNEKGEEIGRGLVNYSNVELQKILGCRSEDIPEILGYVGSETVVHRDNLLITAG